MRIVVNKRKTVILVVVLLILLASLVTLFFFFKDTLFSSNNYIDIYSNCEKKVESGKKVYKCNALLVNRLDKGEEECFVFRLLEGTTLIDKSICERKGNIEWSKEEINWGDTEGSVIPVEILFSTKINIPFLNIYKYDISVNRIEDSEATALLSKIDSVYDIGRVITNEEEKLNEYGYTTAIQNDIGLGYVYFKEVNLEEISEQESTLLVKFSTIFKGEERIFTVRSSQFSYRTEPFVDDDQSRPELINISNYMNYGSAENFSAGLIFVPDSSNLLNKDLNNICSDTKQAIYPVCFHLNIFNEGISSVSDIDDTLENIEDGYLQQFILVSMSKND